MSRTPTAYTNVILVGKPNDPVLYTDISTLGKFFGYFDALFKQCSITAVKNIQPSIEPLNTNPEITIADEHVVIKLTDIDTNIAEFLLYFMETKKTPASVNKTVLVCALAKKWRLTEYHNEDLLNRIRREQNWNTFAADLVYNGIDSLKNQFAIKMIISPEKGAGKVLANIDNLEKYIEAKNFAQLPTDELVDFLARYVTRAELKYNAVIVFKHLTFGEATSRVNKTANDIAVIGRSILNILDSTRDADLKLALLEDYEKKMFLLSTQR